MGTQSPRPVALRHQHPIDRPGQAGRGSRRALIVLGFPACIGTFIAGVLSTLTSAGAGIRAGALIGISVAGAVGLVGRLRGTINLRSFLIAWERPTGWLVFGLGWVMALPLFALHTDVILADSDSARLVASTLYAHRYGWSYLVDSQETFMAHLVLGPLLRLGGIPVAKLFSILETQFLVAVVAFIAWRVAGRLIGSIGAVLALLSIGSILQRTFLLPMYPLMLAAGLLSLVFIYDAATKPTVAQRVRYAGLAAVSLWVCIESHEVGQVFLVTPLLLLVARSVWRGRIAVLVTYLGFALLYVPRLLVNLSEGGLSYVFTNRVDFWITKGYLLDIQLEFWHLPRTASLGKYLLIAPGGIVNIIGWVGLPVLGLALGSLFLGPKRAVWFGLAFAALVFGLSIQLRLPFYPRYFSQLVVGMAIGAGITIAHLTKRRDGFRLFAHTLLVTLVATASFSMGRQLVEAEAWERLVVTGPYATLAAELPQDSRVVGARATYINFLRTDVETYGEQFLSEEELATFLAWPSDEEVILTMRQRDIDFVLVPSRSRRWVRKYHKIWLVPEYGAIPRYQRAVRRSPMFCRVVTDRGAVLYKLDPGSEPGRDC